MILGTSQRLRLLALSLQEVAPGETLQSCLPRSPHRVLLVVRGGILPLILQTLVSLLLLNLPRFPQEESLLLLPREGSMLLDPAHPILGARWEMILVALLASCPALKVFSFHLFL